MKAAVRARYGPAGSISISEIVRPVPHPDEVLVRVHAASVSRTDCHVATGRPLVMRAFTGCPRPRSPVTGSDFAGQVEAVGSAVTSLTPGDRVMGFGGVFGVGSHAEYLAVRETAGIVKMPAQFGYAEAAACLEGACYAAMGITALRPKPSQKALVYGATGAIGVADVQLLKHCGAQVTAVCAAEHGALVRSLGVDRVIDYQTEDFTRDAERYDFVFDAVGKSSFLACRRLLKDKGVFTSSAGLANVFWSMVTPLWHGRRVAGFRPGNVRTTLEFIASLLAGGRFKPVIDRRYALAQIADAFRYVATGQKVGSVIITLDT